MAIVAESTIPVEKFDNEYVVKTRAKGKTELDEDLTEKEKEAADAATD